MATAVGVASERSEVRNARDGDDGAFTFPLVRHREAGSSFRGISNLGAGNADHEQRQILALRAIRSANLPREHNFRGAENTICRPCRLSEQRLGQIGFVVKVNSDFHLGGGQKGEVSDRRAHVPIPKGLGKQPYHQSGRGRDAHWTPLAKILEGTPAGVWIIHQLHIGGVRNEALQRRCRRRGC
jgi:hypothetical protein